MYVCILLSTLKRKDTFFEINKDKGLRKIITKSKIKNPIFSESALIIVNQTFNLANTLL